MTIERRIRAIADNAIAEVERARELFPEFNTYHEGYAVLKEEVDELWQAIKTKPQNPYKIGTEALHVAAMAIRMTLDMDLDQ